MPASTILILDQDSASADSIKSALTRAGYQATVISEPDEAFRVAADFHLLVIDVVAGERTAEDVCREIRATPALAAVPVMCVAQADDVEERVRFLEAGADDVMAKPFDGRELEARVEALLLRFQRSKDLVPVSASLAAPRQLLLAFFSPKGGVGTTTIAVNVALALVDRLGADKVAIVDLDLQWGQVATHLNMRPTLSLGDATQDEGATADGDLLRTYMTRHDSGLMVLPAPPTPDGAHAIPARSLDRLLATTRDSFDAVVVDGGSTLDDRTRALFAQADHVVLPLYPEIAALKALHLLLDTLAESGGIKGMTTYVLNHLFAKEMLKLRDIENTLAARVAVELPFEPIVYLKAVNEGVPVVRGAPRSAPAEQLVRLANLLAGTAPTERAVEPDRRRGLFGSLARRT